MNVGAGVMLTGLNWAQVSGRKEAKGEGNTLPGNFLGAIKLHKE